MVVNGITARSMTEPLQVLSRDGSIRASMGSREEIDLPSRDVAPALRRVTSDGEARIWSSLPTSYEIREWDQKGRLQRWLKRSVDWFPSYFTRRTIDPKAPFPPWIIGMQWLGGDQVAVLTQVAAEGWQRHLGAPVETPGDGTVYPYWDVDKVHDCLIEIIDVRSSEVVLSERIHGYAVGFVDPTHIALYREDSMGNPEVEILEVIYAPESGA